MLRDSILSGDLLRISSMFPMRHCSAAILDLFPLPHSFIKKAKLLVFCAVVVFGPGYLHCMNSQEVRYALLH